MKICWEALSSFFIPSALQDLNKNIIEPKKNNWKVILKINNELSKFLYGQVYTCIGNNEILQSEAQ